MKNKIFKLTSVVISFLLIPAIISWSAPDLCLRPRAASETVRLDNALTVRLTKIKGEMIGTDGMRGEIFATRDEALESLRQSGKIKAGESVGNAELVVRFGILTYEQAYAHGQAYALTFGTEKPFLLGGDPRPHSMKLIEAVAEGIRSQGGSVHIIRVPITTPALAYESKKRGFIGIDVTGSHLLAKEDGIKGFIDGQKLPDEKTVELEKNTYMIAEEKLALEPETPGTKKDIIDENEAYGAYAGYVVKLAETWLGEKPFKGKKIVLDTSNGASREIAPMILRALGAEVIVINDSKNGQLINIQDDGSRDAKGKAIMAGSQNTERMGKAVLAQKADIAAGFDGDADRVMFRDEKGDEIDGDGSLGAISLCKKEDGSLAKNTIVVTTMATVGLRQAMQARGINVVLTKVGDRYISEEMDRNGYVAGGEQSGHTILRDYLPTGDGLIATVILLGYSVKKGVPVSQLTNEINAGIPYLGPHRDLKASTAEAANKVISFLSESERAKPDNEFYNNVLQVIQEEFIDSGIADRYTVADSKQDKYVKSKELYIQLWDKNGKIKGWISFRQSGTEPKTLRIYLNVDCPPETAERARGKLVDLVADKLDNSDGTALSRYELGRIKDNMPAFMRRVDDERKQERYDVVSLGGGSCVSLNGYGAREHNLTFAGVACSSDNGGLDALMEHSLQRELGHTIPCGDITNGFKGLIGSWEAWIYDTRGWALTSELYDGTPLFSTEENAEFIEAVRLKTKFSERLRLVIEVYKNKMAELEIPVTPEFIKFEREIMSLARLVDNHDILTNNPSSQSGLNMDIASVRHATFYALMMDIGAYSASTKKIDEQRFKAGLYLLQKALGAHGRVSVPSTDQQVLYAEWHDKKGRLTRKAAGEKEVSLAPDVNTIDRGGVLDVFQLHPRRRTAIKIRPYGESLEILDQVKPGGRVIMGPSSLVVSLSSSLILLRTKLAGLKGRAVRVLVLNNTYNSETMSFKEAGLMGFINFIEKITHRPIADIVDCIVVNTDTGENDPELARALAAKGHSRETYKERGPLTVGVKEAAAIESEKGIKIIREPLVRLILKPQKTTHGGQRIVRQWVAHDPGRLTTVIKSIGLERLGPEAKPVLPKAGTGQSALSAAAAGV